MAFNNVKGDFRKEFWRRLVLGRTVDCHGIQADCEWVWVCCADAVVFAPVATLVDFVMLGDA